MDKVLEKYGEVFTGREVTSVLNEHNLAIQYSNVMGCWHADTPGIRGHCTPRDMHDLLGRKDWTMKFVVREEKLVGVLEIEDNPIMGPIYHLVFDLS